MYSCGFLILLSRTTSSLTFCVKLYEHLNDIVTKTKLKTIKHENIIRHRCRKLDTHCYMDVFFKVKNINVEYFKTNIGYQ